MFDNAAKLVQRKWMVLLDRLVAVRGCCTGLQFSAHPTIDIKRRFKPALTSHLPTCLLTTNRSPIDKQSRKCTSALITSVVNV